ncbi:MAG: serine/threonine protein kinase, partial [Candidatus Competibacteraceae bacterium]|nr:serine/threonine protein kinase [Candidatus Competibacteraceae bacterium]
MSKTEKLPIIPGYDVKRMIGQGGMAMVYLAEQRTLQRLVALKIMSPALSADDTFTSRFLKEGATAANLAHPKIIKVFDSGVHDNHYYIAMEYLSGGTLKDKLKTLSIPDALQILKDMTDALSYAHEHGVVHRDIKSQNILMYPDGTPILSDFGVAKALDGSTALTRSGMAIGSPGYMSPEQLRGLPIDGRTDIYALGILFYEMLMGELPYQATDQFAIAYKHIYDPIPELPAKLAIFKPLLDKTLAKDPADRVADAKELLALIERIEIAYYSTLTGDTKGLSSADLKRITLEHKKQPVDKPPRRRSYIMPTALILVVVLAGGGYYYYTLRTADTLSAATTQLLTEANAAKQAGDYQTSLNHIAKALALAPQSQQVIALHREVIALQSRQQQQQQRQAELEQVRQQAQTLYQQGQLQDSLAAIEKGLALAADDSSLLTLRDTIQTDLQRQQQQQTLATLQREAE